MIRTGEQFDLLAWSPPETVAAFDPQMIRANSYGGRLSRAISVSLDGCGYSRAEIAARMSEHMGRKISLNILNAYASVARDTHEISVTRFNALISATGDRRLLEFMAADHGFSVIDRRYLPMIELAAVQEHKREIARKEREIRAVMGHQDSWGSDTGVLGISLRLDLVVGRIGRRRSGYAPDLGDGAESHMAMGAIASDRGTRSALAAIARSRKGSGLGYAG